MYKIWLIMKKILFILTIFIISFITTACDNKESYILFNKYPFSEQTMKETTNVFQPGDKIYYLITTPKPVETNKLLVQVYKLGSNERLGYELMWGKMVKIRNEQVYYYTDYFTLNQTGAYVMNVYSKDYPTKMLTTNNFYIRN